MVGLAALCFRLDSERLSFQSTLRDAAPLHAEAVAERTRITAFGGEIGGFLSRSHFCFARKGEGNFLHRD